MTESTPLSWPAATQRLRIANLQIDLRYRLLSRDGEHDIELPQRVFDLLVLFLAEPHVLHSRAELFERVWQDVVVEDANLSQTVWLLRKALGPDCKAWVRTVAKSGYVFEPPSSPEVVDGSQAVIIPGPDSAAIDDDTTEEAPPVVAITRDVPTPAVRAKRIHWLLASGLLAVLAILMLSFWVRTRQADSPPAPPAKNAITVALVDVVDPAAGDNARWPGRLLRAWLEWKLSSLPDVRLLSEADLAASTATATPRVILLTSGMSVDRPGEIYLRVRIGEGNQPLLRTGPAARVPALVDELSGLVLAQLLPQRTRDTWPVLGIDAKAAQRFVEAYDAGQRRDWLASLAAGHDVIAQAPQFGLARLQTARTLSRLGQAAAAQEQMTAARKSLQPLPDEAAALLEAIELSINPQRQAQAAQAYGVLAARYPQQIGFALSQAHFLILTGELQQAREILMRPDWERQPVGVRISHLLALAEVDGTLGDIQRARSHAQTAESLAEAAGTGWAQERGKAMLLQARLDTTQFGAEADNTGYERAAMQFELAGDRADALYARVLAETAAPAKSTDTAAVNPNLAKMLAQVHADGYRHIEIELLQRAAFQHYSAGHHAQYRTLQEQALAIAVSSGNVPVQHGIELNLLNEDMQRGDLTSAQQRIERLHDSKLQGSQAAWVNQFESTVAAFRGQYSQALAILDRSEAAANERGTPLPPLAVARNDCARGEILLQLGRLPQSRAAWTRCAQPKQPYARWLAQLAAAINDLTTGDRSTALAGLRASNLQVAQTPDGPDRWFMSIALAPAFTRAGDHGAAKQLYAAVLPGATSAGYDWLVAQAHAGLAEVEAVRGEWDASAAHAATARKLIPGDAWVITYRLDEVAIAAALARGEQSHAHALLVALDAKAHAHGDVMVQLEVHGLLPKALVLPDCTPASRNALIASTGLRGVNLEWLTAKTGTEVVKSH